LRTLSSLLAPPVPGIGNHLFLPRLTLAASSITAVNCLAM
jgi:hypothetical protein